MNPKLLFILLTLIGLQSYKSLDDTIVYESEILKVEKLTKSTYRHITYLPTEDYGLVGCNGMIVIDNNEALIFDTPTNNKVSEELINWVENNLDSKVIGIVVTHFHEDCLGGLNAFHKKDIPSYASFKTIELAKQNNIEIPQIGFEKTLELKVGTKVVVNDFLGEGHSVDNIVSYFPSEEVLFGGCLIKKVGASKGYLGDANIAAWSNTVLAVKAKYGDAKVIIPGHGKPGNVQLLDYTIDLFKTK